MSKSKEKNGKSYEEQIIIEKIHETEKEKLSKENVEISKQLQEAKNMVKSLNEELSQLNPSILSNKKDSEDKILKLEYDITEERKFNSTRKDMTTKLEHKMSEVTVEKELLRKR